MVKVKGKMSHTADTSAFGCRTMSSNCSDSWLRYNQGATPGGFAFPTRNSWYPLYRPRRDERLGEPRPGFEPTTTKSRNRPRQGSNTQPRDPESNALTLTQPGRRGKRTKIKRYKMYNPIGIPSIWLIRQQSMSNPKNNFNILGKFWDKVKIQQLRSEINK